MFSQDSPKLSLPAWAELGLDLRGRMEMSRGANFVSGADDTYYYHRARLDLGVKPFSWLRVHAQVQENQAPGYKDPVPAASEEGTDLRQAFVEVNRGGDTHWGARIGRQEMTYGGERLVGASNWGNSSRSYDAARLFYETKQLRVDAFASTVVAIDAQHFDRYHSSPQLHGLYMVSKKWIPKGTLESFFLVKIDPRDTSELGKLGRTQVYTPGVRFQGKLPMRFDYLGENAIQWGRIGADRERAWAGSWSLGYTVAKGARAPRLVATFSHGSGDHKYGDGHRGTFDQLFPTNHQYYGLVDRVGWRNMQEVAASVIVQPRAKWNVRAEYHSFWLASRSDYFYLENGRTLIRNPNATSSYLGQELSANVAYRLSKRLDFVVGGGPFFPGAYLQQSKRGARGGIFYAQWHYTI